MTFYGNCNSFVDFNASTFAVAAFVCIYFVVEGNNNRFVYAIITCHRTEQQQKKKKKSFCLLSTNSEIESSSIGYGWRWKVAMCGNGKMRKWKNISSDKKSCKSFLFTQTALTHAWHVDRQRLQHTQHFMLLVKLSHQTKCLIYNVWRK
jgi:hypothetical protein